MAIADDEPSTDDAVLTTTTDPQAAPDTRRVTNDDFLVPGPTPESNAGLGRWGLSWLIFSVVLILLMLGMSFVCWVIATWVGMA